MSTTPDSLGGYQHIIHGEVNPGDLLVWHEGVEQIIQPVEILIGISVVCLKPEYRIYRRMPTPANHA